MNDELLKMVIIDDERLVRDLLKRCISWEDIGITIVGESSNAIEGLELVDRLLPDIIFTDICMPVMDGLEFSRKVAEKHPRIRTIVLTGHEEFEYAKKGIKVGIADFLLKPINDDEIRKTALMVKEKILKERSQIDEYDRLKEQLQQNLPFLKEKLFNEMIQSKVDPCIIEERLSFFNIGTKDDIYQIAAMEVSYAEEDECGEEERELILKIRCWELTEQYFVNDSYVNVFLDNSRRIIILSNESAIDLWECCDAIKSMLINRLKCFVFIGVGNAYNALDEIYISYKEACDALKYRSIVGENQVVSFFDISWSGEKKLNFNNELLENFCFYLKSTLKDKTEELVSEAFLEARTAFVSIEEVRVFACNFIANILNVLIESKIRQEEVFEANAQPFETVFRLDTLPKAEEFIKQISFKAIQAINSLQGKKARKIIQDVREYIDCNYTQPGLSFSEVAKKFYVNLSYLSRTFKEETGLTFVDYLNKLRMEKAIKLLNSTDKKAYEIAEEVGISDSHYFSVCFKKYTGLSVNDFRKNKQ